MNKTIWFISPYGAIPTEPWRDSRFVVFAKCASAQGIQVVWWTAGFSHQTKLVRSSVVQDIAITDGFTVRLVPTTAYKRNIGIGRLISNFVFGWRVYKMGLRQQTPDCIITGEPPTTMGYAGFRLAKKMRCKIIYDQIDLWPELFVKMSPSLLKPLVWFSCLPVYWSRAVALKRVDGVIGLSKKYLACALAVARSLEKLPCDVIYNGINVSEFRKDMVDNEAVCKIKKMPGETLVIYSGSLGPSYDIETIIESVLALRRQGRFIRLVIAGDGPLRSFVLAKADDSPEAIVYLGMVSSAILRSVYGKCDIGLASYRRGSNVEMPDKFYDYTAAGLVVVSSLQGEVRDIIEQEKVGRYYEPGSIESCTLCLKGLLDDAATRAEMSEKSALIAEHFSSEIQGKKFIQILMRVMN